MTFIYKLDLYHLEICLTCENKLPTLRLWEVVLQTDTTEIIYHATCKIIKITIYKGNANPHGSFIHRFTSLTPISPGYPSYISRPTLITIRWSYDNNVTAQLDLKHKQNYRTQKNCFFFVGAQMRTASPEETSAAIGL